MDHCSARRTATAGGCPTTCDRPTCWRKLEVGMEHPNRAFWLGKCPDVLMSLVLEISEKHPNRKRICWRLYPRWVMWKIRTLVLGVFAAHLFCRTFFFAFGLVELWLNCFRKWQVRKSQVHFWYCEEELSTVGSLRFLAAWILKYVATKGWKRMGQN